MVVAGAVLNAVVTLFASVCYFYVSVQLSARRTARATTSFLQIVSFFLTLASARQVAAALGADDIDRAIFYVLLVPAAFAIVPLIRVVIRVLTDNARLQFLVPAAFAAVLTIGLGFAYARGVTGPLRSAFGTDWEINSLVARAMLLLVIMLPGLASAVILIVAGRKMQDDAGRRARLLGWSCGVYYLVFTADAFGLSGLELIGARFVTAVAALVAYMAFRPRAEVPSPAP